MIERLISELRRQGVRIRLEGDRIRCDAPPGVITAELTEQLRERKERIIEFLRKELAASEPNRGAVVPTASRGGDVHLSFQQESLWFLDQLSPGSATYNMPLRLHLWGKIDEDVLRRSLNEIVSRHEILRTCFRTSAGRPIQVIGTAPILSVPLEDLTHRPEGVREAEAEALCRDQAMRPFVLDQDLMLRATLIRLDAEKYILFVNLHHIACDAWSIGILLRELGILYEAFSNGKPSPLQALAVQYADFAAWQREALTGEVLAHQLKYWKNQLAGAPPILAMPTEFSRPPVQTFRGAVATVELPPSLAIALRTLAKAEGVSLFMTLLAAFQVLLYRYSGQHDIVVGSPLANRSRTEVEGLIGLFVNTLPLRTDLSGNPTFKELLSRTREVVLGAHENQDVPFELLVKELQPERGLSHGPLFQVLFAVENAQPGPVNLKVHAEFISNATSKFDLSLYIREYHGGMTAELEYCTDLFGRETIIRILDHFAVLLKGIIEAPNGRIDTLPLLTAKEKEALLFQHNRTRVNYQRDWYLDELFEERSRAGPDRVAVRYGDDLLTYRELNERADKIASRLRVLGVGPGDLVGFYVERSLDMPIGLLGILKTGGAYLPLDPGYPPDRLAFMLEDARPRVVLTQRRLETVLPHKGMTLVFLDDLSQIGGQDSAPATSGRERRPSDIAYVIYTSGSTGTPKGVQVAHRSIVNFLSSMRVRPGLTENDILLAVTTLSFDIAALELFLPLTVGAVVVIASTGACSDATQLALLLEQHRVTVMQATPTTWYLLLETRWAGSPDLKILCGGEAWSSHLAERLLPRCGSLWNMYGPTEATVWASVREIKRDARVLIGPPIANTRFYVLQKDLQLVPPLVAGELYIAGDCLARGYLFRPELTDEKFIRSPFNQTEEDRLYKTGDLVRYIPDGAFEFLGRADSQVKIRGFRIELDEIAAVLRKHGAVYDAVAVVQQSGRLDQRLVAYVVAVEGEKPDGGDLQAFVKRQLPSYMVPSTFEIVERLPLTPAGKVDRQALQTALVPRSERLKGHSPPRTITECTVANIWSEVLGVGEVGTHDNFFDLGGHSLLIVRMLYQINTTCKVRLSVSDLFHKPTVRELAAVVDSQRSESQRRSVVVQLQRGEESETPLYFIYAGPDEFHLAQLMGARRPVFGIQPPFPQKWLRAVESNQLSSLPDMDQFVVPFAEALAAHVGSGRCMLAGHSFAGLVAFEAARHLQKRGGHVDTVIIVDKWSKYPPPVRVAWENLRQCWSVKAGDTGQSLARSITHRCRRCLLIIWWPLRLVAAGVLAQVRRLPDRLTTTFDEEGVPVPWGILERLYWRIEANYRPYPLDCRGIIFRTDFMDVNHSVRVLDENLGWARLFTRGTVNCSLSGDHISIFRQHNQKLALMINRVLEQSNDSTER